MSSATKNRRDKRHVRREPENPGAFFRDDLILVEQLPQIAIRLEDARPAFGLNHLLEPREHAGRQRRENHHHGGLQDVEEDALEHGLCAAPDGRYASGSAYRNR